MKPVLVVKTGSAIAGVPEQWGDFEHWIAAGADLEPGAWLECNVTNGSLLPGPDSVAGIIITGSPAMVTDQDEWIGYTSGWLREAINAGLPVLGICFGHQLLGHALGGNVIYHPEGREIGTTQVTHTGAALKDELFTGLPASYQVHVTHSQTIEKLPHDAVVLAGNSFEPHHAVRFRHRVWGVQFHPEFNAQIMRKYLELRSDVIRSEGLDVDSLLIQITETPTAAELLRRFAAICKQ